MIDVEANQVPPGIDVHVHAERYDFLVHSAERGHMWREAIRAHRAGEPGIPAREAIRDLAEELALEL